MIKDFFRKYKNHIYPLLIVVFVFTIYSNNYNADFQIDDHHVILNNEKIKDLSNFTQISPWTKIIFNREFAYFTFAINYAIHGYDLWGYHFINNLIHVLASLSVYWLIMLIFLTPSIKDLKISRNKYLIALFTALIFAAHPLQTQAVTYITQRMASLAALFYFLSIGFYMKGRLIQFRKEKERRDVLYFIGALISFILGHYSKATILSLPLAIITVEFIFFRTDSKPNYKLILSYSLLIIAAAILVVIIRGKVPMQSEGVEPLVYFFTQINVLITYIRLMFLPTGLQVFWNYPLSESLFEMPTIINLLLHIGLVSLAIYSFKQHKIISFAIAWFYITQIIESSFFSLKYVIFEYRVYPSLLGFSLAIAYAVFAIIPKRNYSKVILLLIVAVFGIDTVSRNEVWQSGLSLWKDNVEKAPMHAVPHNNLGTYYLKENDTRNALISFTNAINLDPKYADAYNHRGVLYKNLGEYEKSLSDLKTSLKLNPTNPLTLNNIGYAYQGLNELDSAIYYYKKATEVSKKHPTAYDNLAIVYKQKKDYAEALTYVNKALSQDSSNAKFYNNRGNIFFEMKELDHALKSFIKALEKDPNYYKAINNVGVVYVNKSEFNKAETYFTEAISKSRDYSDPYLGRAIAYLNTNRLELAKNDLLKYLAISPNNKKAQSLLQQINQNLKAY